MSFEKYQYEREGLKIDKERVLTYSQLSCPLECSYCFVEDINFNQKRKVSYLSERQFELIEELPAEIELIMLGCDTEFFQNKEDSIAVLNRLSKLDKDISLITKLNLKPEFVKKLAYIDKCLRNKGNFLSFSVSVPCLKSYKKWEPKTPSPIKRIETLKVAFENGISTMLALRPLLPDVSDEELEDIIKLTKDYCYGYYSGPLYLKSLDGGFINEQDKNINIEKSIQPHWMPEGNIFHKIIKNGQMEKLKELLDKYDKPLFEGAAEGMKYLRNYEKH